MRTVHSETQPTWITSKDEKEMMIVWPDVVRDLTDAVQISNFAEVSKWMTKVNRY